MFSVTDSEHDSGTSRNKKKEESEKGEAEQDISRSMGCHVPASSSVFSLKEVFSSTAFFYVKIVFISCCLALFLKLFVIDAFVIPSESMENLLLPGDYILVNKLSYSFATPVTLPFRKSPIPSIRLITWATPSRNDVVVFYLPDHVDIPDAFHEEFFIKRVIGLPGEQIEIQDKVVRCNGVEIPASPKALFVDNPEIPGKADRKIFPHGTPWNKDNYGPILIPYSGLVVRQGDPRLSYYMLILMHSENLFLLIISWENTVSKRIIISCSVIIGITAMTVGFGAFCRSRI
jgi:signal peptidase I